MIVDHFAATLFGGAGIGTRRLHESLREIGVDSRLWYGLDDPHHPASGESYGRWKWRPSNPSRLGRYWARVRREVRKLTQQTLRYRALRGRTPGLEHFSSPWRPHSTPWDVTAAGTQIIHLHWVAELIDYPSFFASLPPGFPVVWTLRDMNPFTGGCHYAGRCDAFTRHCGHCPQLGRPGADDLTAQAFRVKESSIQGLNLHLIAPSHWIAHEARRSTLLQWARSLQIIPHGIDTQAFAPVEREFARRHLGLPLDKPVIAFGAESLANHRKGYGLLLEALARLPSELEVWGLAFGERTTADQKPAVPRILEVGYLASPIDQSLVYSAADLFVLPSLEENLAKTALEAMACGTPVVAFRAGGAPDYIRPRETGLLADVGDVDNLSRQIHWLLERPLERQLMGQQAREMVVRELNARTIAQRHRRLYESLLRDSEWRQSFECVRTAGGRAGTSSRSSKETLVR